MDVSLFDYHLPEELIAQQPLDKRDASRLMVLNRTDHTIEDRIFSDIGDYLKPGDLLVLNNSKVIPARIFGVKEVTGVACEFLLSKHLEGNLWETMVRPGRRLKKGDVVDFPGNCKATITDYGEDGTRIVEFECDGSFMAWLDEVGKMPLPPYIERAAEAGDKERYQTVYAKEEGSVAAPTAGLHFTPELLASLEEKGVGTAYVTLHVGIGTFRPVKADKVEDHHMHFEEYFIDDETAARINETKSAGGRIIAVGTTSTRTLESAAMPNGEVMAGEGRTDIFIYPGYEFKVLDGLITNFHLPKSTLIMLVSAFYDREHVLAAYAHGVAERYRFFSYGDAMLLL